ncbi:hypothetical protein D7Z54_10145 [Salibacterium salarium]|uniref:Uncharacterized protein n=1 Tax=Salibacterium salarium TaxID=284579 RepID=A0A3R9QLB5_9BACI|nr:hypothetical protein [Salibacterium salarium]RSL33327.1 hypothetical protein D7Z54_10145 [Salibacterium salarium]
MNNFRWTAPFSNMGRRRKFFGWNRSNNNQGRMGMILTLLGVSAGAAWYGISQRNNDDDDDGSHPIQKGLADMKRSMPETETAFSKEFMPDSFSTNGKE